MTCPNCQNPDCSFAEVHSVIKTSRDALRECVRATADNGALALAGTISSVVIILDWIDHMMTEKAEANGSHKSVMALDRH